MTRLTSRGCLAGALAIVGIAVLPAQTLTGEQTRILEESRKVAVNYSRWLPDLICTEVVRREIDYGSSGHWASADTLTVQVTYFERKESYKLVARNQHSSNQRLETLSGAISEGEFGSMLRWIFEPDAHALFEWEGTEKIGHTSTSVFQYRILAANSRLELAALTHRAFVGFHGRVWVDDDKLALRLTAEIEAPENFPIRDSSVRIDYDWTAISGHRYLVPVRAETVMTESPPDAPLDPLGNPRAPVGTRYRNRIEFRNYRKYTADSKIRFDGPGATGSNR